MNDNDMFKQMIDWVNCDKNKKRRIYFYGLCEKIAEKYSDEIVPNYTAPVGGYTIKNGRMELKEGFEKIKTNHSTLKITNPDYQMIALVEACRNNPYSMNVKGHIGVPIYFCSLMNNASGDVEEITLSINNILFNGLCTEAKIPFELEEVEELPAW